MAASPEHPSTPADDAADDAGVRRPPGTPRDGAPPASDPDDALDAPTDPALTEPRAAGGTSAPRDRLRMWVAVAMALVSLASAGVTFVAAQHDGAAADLYAQSSQQWSEEQQVEQQVEALVAEDERLTTALDQQLQGARAAAAAAAALRTIDPARAAEQDLAMQTHNRQIMQLWRFLRGGAPTATTAGYEYDAVKATTWLQSTDSRLYRASSEQTLAAARAEADVASSAVRVVVLLVAVLFLLTLAHLFGGRTGAVLAIVAGACAAAALVLLWITDLAAAAIVSIGTAIVVVALARAPRIGDWLSGGDSTDDINAIGEVPAPSDAMAAVGPDKPSVNRFSRIVAGGIAGATLFAAIVGYLHIDASRGSTDAGWRAHDLGVAAIGALRGDEEGLAVDLDQYLRGAGLRVDGWGAAQLARWADVSGQRDAGTIAAAESTRLEEDADQLLRASPLASVLTASGASSRSALLEPRGAVWADTARLVALQDAENAAAIAADARASALFSVLTWLAVAVYLLGLSLLFRTRGTRRLLAGAGVMLIAFAVAQVVVVQARSTATADGDTEAAADEYAKGVVAQQSLDPADAAKHFARALELRPDFGLASRDLAQAILDGGSAPGLGVRSAFSPEAVDAAIAALDDARSNRAETAGVMLNLGAVWFHRAVQTGADADMRRSLEYSRRGIELGRAARPPGTPPPVNELIGRSNSALALLALGEAAEARSEYASASAAIGAFDDLERGFIRPFFASAMLAPLDALAESTFDVDDDLIAEMKGIIVTGAYRVPATESPAHISTASIEVFPSIVQWRADIPGFDAKRDRLAAQWYRFDDKVGGWSAINVLSGPLVFGGLADGSRQFGSDVRPGSYWGASFGSLLDTPPTCVLPARYRVELYLNGRLEASAEADATTRARYDIVSADDLSIALCRPADWTTRTSPGLGVVASTADGRRGVAVLRIEQPFSASVSQGDAVLDRLPAAGAGLLPEGLSGAERIDQAGEPTVLAGSASVRRRFTYDGGGVLKAAAVAQTDGQVVVVCVFGPADWVDSPPADELFISAILG